MRSFSIQLPVENGEDRIKFNLSPVKDWFLNATLLEAHRVKDGLVLSRDEVDTVLGWFEEMKREGGYVVAEDHDVVRQLRLYLDEPPEE